MSNQTKNEGINSNSSSGKANNNDYGKANNGGYGKVNNNNADGEFEWLIIRPVTAKDFDPAFTCRQY